MNMADTTTAAASAASVPGIRGPALSPEDSETLFIESLVILALSILGTAAVMAAVLHRKYDRQSHAHYAERWRRHREIRKFLDFTVRAWWFGVCGGLVWFGFGVGLPGWIEWVDGRTGFH